MLHLEAKFVETATEAKSLRTAKINRILMLAVIDSIAAASHPLHAIEWMNEIVSIEKCSCVLNKSYQRICENWKQLKGRRESEIQIQICEIYINKG